MKQLLVVSLILLSVRSSAATDTLRVLFVGNSYVQVNNLPDIIRNIAADRGDAMIWTDASVGGYTLQNHSANANTLAQIAQKGWDYVVLQEQSELPAFPDAQVIQDCYPYAHKLDSLIHAANPCAKTVFYMTWGRKNGDASNCASFPLICTYNGMDSLLRARYTIMAQTNGALLAPVGVAWHKMRDTHPATELYQTDESHPSEAGSYLAALSFYTLLFRKDASLTMYDFTLGTADAFYIRQAVRSQVWDSLSKWYAFQTPAPQPVAGFSNTNTGLTVHFTNTSTKARNYKWSFGDGGTDTVASPVHIYSANGTYTVRLIAINCNSKPDTFSKVLVIGGTGVATPLGSGILVYPNPASGQIRIAAPALPANVLLYDLQGKICRSVPHPLGKEVTLDVKGLPAGIYNLRIVQADGSVVTQLVTVWE